MQTRDYRSIIEDIESRIGSARLMAVSKTRSIEEIMDVYDAGCRLFGENHVQEIVAKFRTKPADLELHMIGHLQSNKVGKVVPLVDMIESVDSMGLLKKIDAAAQRAGKVIDVLLEVNTSKEEAKSGFQSTEELFECLGESALMKNVRVRGLMTVAPYTDDAETNRPYFRTMHDLMVDINQKNIDNISVDVLSMGMSGDYGVAVEEGATHIRVGTYLFGERDYSK